MVYGLWVCAASSRRSSITKPKPTTEILYQRYYHLHGPQILLLATALWQQPHHQHVIKITAPLCTKSAATPAKGTISNFPIVVELFLNGKAFCPEWLAAFLFLKDESLIRAHIKNFNCSCVARNQKSAVYYQIGGCYVLAIYQSNFFLEFQS